LAKSKKTLQENQSQLKANKAELKQLYALDNSINDTQFARLELLEKENALLEKNIASQKRNKKAIEDSAKAIRENNKFLNDTEDILGSIADKVGKQHNLYKEGEKYLERQSQQVLDTLNEMADETEKFAKSVTASTKEFNALDNVMGSFSGLPAMSELNTLLKTNIKDTVAFKAAVFALGAALGKAAFDYFGAPIKTAMEQYKQSAQNRIDTEANIGKLQVDAQSIPKQIEQERLEARVNAEGDIQRLQQEAAFAGAKAAIQFSAQMQSGAAAFERDSIRNGSSISCYW